MMTSEKTDFVESFMSDLTALMEDYEKIPLMELTVAVRSLKKKLASIVNLETLIANHERASLVELATTIRVLKVELDEAAKEKTEIQKAYDFITISVTPDKMDDEGVQTMNVKDVGRLQSTASIRCSCPAANKNALEQWLRDNNHGAMIKDVINASTLKAFVIEQMKAEDGKYPKDLLKIEPFSRATVVQA